MYKNRPSSLPLCVLLSNVQLANSSIDSIIHTSDASVQTPNRKIPPRSSSASKHHTPDQAPALICTAHLACPHYRSRSSPRTRIQALSHPPARTSPHAHAHPRHASKLIHNYEALCYHHRCNRVSIKSHPCIHTIKAHRRTSPHHTESSPFRLYPLSTRMLWMRSTLALAVRSTLASRYSSSSATRTATRLLT